MAPIVICAITTSSLVSRNGIRRDSASYVLSCMKLILQLKTLAVCWLVLLQSRNPRCRFHTPIFPFFVFIMIGGEKKKADKSHRTYRLRYNGCHLTSVYS